MAVTAAPVAPPTTRVGRDPRVRDFVRLKFRMLRNGFRGQTWRIVAFVLALVFGVWMAGFAILGYAASAVTNRDTGYVVAVLSGGVVVLGWTLVPLLFFGVDETLDPARFALLPVRRSTLARGMLAAAFLGVPALVTLLATSGLALAAAIRFGPVGAAVALVGVIAGLTLGIVASRAVTSAFAALLRSRRVRDLAAVAIALLASSASPLQLLVTSWAGDGDLSQAVTVADVVSWTPVGAPYALPYDVAEGRPLSAAVRLVMVLVSIGLLLWWWSYTLESAMIGVTTSAPARRRAGATASAVTALLPAPLRRLVPRPGRFAAIVARESRFWWRDPRRRASLVSILMASAVVPLALNLASGPIGPTRTGLAAVLPFSLAVTMSGTMGGMMLANQFAFDGNAYAAHLLASVPGRVELRARATAIAVVAVPVQLVVVLAVTVLTGDVRQVPAGLGILVAAFGAAVATAGFVSVLAPYALPDNANPFALNSAGGSAKGLLALVAMIGTLVITAPVVVGATLLAPVVAGPWLVLGIGLAYGAGAILLGTYMAGDLLERRGPQVLISVTPRR